MVISKVWLVVVLATTFAVSGTCIYTLSVHFLYACISIYPAEELYYNIASYTDQRLSDVLMVFFDLIKNQETSPSHHRHNWEWTQCVIIKM